MMEDMTDPDLHDVKLTIAGAAEPLTIGRRTADEVRDLVRTALDAWNDPHASGSVSITGTGPSDGVVSHINLRLVSRIDTDVVHR